MEDKTIITITALIVLAFLMAIALFLGYDGTLLASVIGILGIVAGAAGGIQYQKQKV